MVFLICSYFHVSDSSYTISKLTLFRKSFPTIYNMPGPFSIYFFTKKYPETIRRGWLNLKHPGQIIHQIHYFDHVLTVMYIVSRVHTLIQSWQSIPFLLNSTYSGTTSIWYNGVAHIWVTMYPILISTYKVSTLMPQHICLHIHLIQWHGTYWWLSCRHSKRIAWCWYRGQHSPSNGVLPVPLL